MRLPIEIVRIVRPLRGQPRLRIDFDPRPDYARADPTVVETADGLDVPGGSVRSHLSTNLPVPYVTGRDFVLNRPVFFVLTHGHRDTAPSLASVQHELDLTIAGWRAWTKTCALPTFRADDVLRSALCLKLHVYHDTGAIIAAATTSRLAFEQAVRRVSGPDLFIPTLTVDAELDLGEISEELVDQLETLMPFGVGNPEPLFMARDIAVISSSWVGQHHRRMVLRQASGPAQRTIRAIHFHAGPGSASQDRFERLAFKLRWNRWNGSRTVQMVIEEAS